MIRIGIIGTGGIAKWHASRYQAIRGSKVVACADIVEEKARSFAEEFGIAAAYPSAPAMLAAEDLDAVSVATIDSAHAEPSILALRAGLHVLCEKPLADTLRDARRMAREAEKHKRLTAVNFSYRNNPATQKAHELVQAGAIGKVVHVEGRYLQSWLVPSRQAGWKPGPAALWRLSTAHGSNGVLGDLGVHLYDLASFVAGDFAEISCRLATLPKRKKKIGAYVFDANDTANATVAFANGGTGVLHTTRWATTHGNTVALRVYGDEGALDLDLDRPAPETLRACLGLDAVRKRKWKNVRCKATPDMYARFITSIRTGKQGQTSFAGGAQVQAYLDAAAKSDRQSGKAVKL